MEYDPHVLVLAMVGAIAAGVMLSVNSLFGLLTVLFNRESFIQASGAVTVDQKPQPEGTQWLACSGALAAVSILAVCWSLGDFTLAAIVAVGLALLASFASGQVSRHRGRQLELTLPMALQQIANEMAATGSLDRALEAIAETTPSPAREELALLRSRLAALGLEGALERTADRLKSESFSLMAAVIRVGMQRGGNTIQALKDLSTTLIELERLRRKIRTASASSSRAMLLMFIVAPIVLFATLVWMPNGDQLFHDPKGQLVLLLSVSLMAGALYLFLRLTRIKV